MTRRARDAAGFTFIEVTLAMALMLVVFSATLAAFGTMERNGARNQRLNELQQQARTATETLAKRLRNLASPSDSGNALDQQPLERAQPQDLVFRTVKSDGNPTTGNPQNLERYRYCLGTSASNNKTLFEQRQTWTAGATITTPAVPSSTSCPASSGWDVIGGQNYRTVATGVVNGTRSLFSYQGSPVPGTYTELDSVAPADFPTAIALRTTLWLDPDTAHPPGATNMTTRVFLRNQNRPPVASFTMSWQGKRVTLNASASDDPEGNPLQYLWLDNGAVMTDPTTGLALTASQNAVYTFNASNGSHSYNVKVIDVGGLTATGTARSLNCPSNQAACS
jgi:type II secretory pathway component PulJ